MLQWRENFPGIRSIFGRPDVFFWVCFGGGGSVREFRLLDDPHLQVRELNAGAMGLKPDRP